MSDDEQKALNESDVNTPEATPATEEKPSEDVKPTEADVKSTEETQPNESETKPNDEVNKKSAQGRIRQLNSKLKEEVKQKSLLEEKLAQLQKEELNNPFSQVNNPLPDIEELATPNEESEITYEQYQADVRAQAQKAARQELANYERIRRQKEEAMMVVQKYPQLDSKSDKYDPVLSDVIVEAVTMKQKLDPNMSVSKTVDKLIKPYLKSVENAVSESREEIVKQVAQQAVTPGVQAPQENSSDKFEDKSLEQMEKELGIVYH